MMETTAPSTNVRKPSMGLQQITPLARDFKECISRILEFESITDHDALAWDATSLISWKARLTAMPDAPRRLEKVRQLKKVMTDLDRLVGMILSESPELRMPKKPRVKKPQARKPTEPPSAEKLAELKSDLLTIKKRVRFEMGINAQTSDDDEDSSEDESSSEGEGSVPKRRRASTDSHQAHQ